MAADEEEDLYCREEQDLMITPSDPSSSMVVIRESPIFAKDDDLLVFPPIYHENLIVGSYVYGEDNSYLESSSSPSDSSPRRSGSSSSFSLFPSDSEFERKSPSETEEKSTALLVSPSSDSHKQSPLKSPSPPSDQDGKFLSKPLNREIVMFHDWWKLLLVRVYSKLNNLVTWFSTTLRSFYPVLAIAIWWWIRVRARRKQVKGRTINHLQDVIKERDERIVQLLHQIAQMNELLVKHHKDFISRR